MPNSKDKGARFEREIAQAFREAGFTDAHRSAQYCGQTGDAPDVAGVPGLHIECKHYKDTEWKDEWWQQALRDRRLGTMPVVIHKTDRHKPKVKVGVLGLELMTSVIRDTMKDEEILVDVDLDDFLRMFKNYEGRRWRPDGEK